MNSEKVKEIKEKLQEEIFIANSFGDKLRKVPTKELENLLTLINELESENERLRLERDVLIGKKIVEKQKHDKAIIMKIDIQKQLKNRIAELEKENETKTDTIVNLLKKQEFYETEKLKQFAERLKEKAHKGASRDPITYKFIERDYTITESELKELLKEYIDEE